MLVALSASEAINGEIWATVPATQVYLAGSLWLVAGLSIVLAHNRWTGGWPVLITVVGWFAIVGGLVRMFFPEFALRGTPNPSAVLAVQSLLFASGIVLIFKSYRRDVPVR